MADQLLLTGVDEASSLCPLRCKYREKLISLDHCPNDILLIESVIEENKDVIINRWKEYFKEK